MTSIERNKENARLEITNQLGNIVEQVATRRWQGEQSPLGIHYLPNPPLEMARDSVLGKLDVAQAKRFTSHTKLSGVYQKAFVDRLKTPSSTNEGVAPDFNYTQDIKNLFTEVDKEYTTKLSSLLDQVHPDTQVQVSNENLRYLVDTALMLAHLKTIDIPFPGLLVPEQRPTDINGFVITQFDAVLVPQKTTPNPHVQFNLQDYWSKGGVWAILEIKAIFDTPQVTGNRERTHAHPKHIRTINTQIIKLIAANKERNFTIPESVYFVYFTGLKGIATFSRRIDYLYLEEMARDLLYRKKYINDIGLDEESLNYVLSILDGVAQIKRELGVNQQNTT